MKENQAFPCLISALQRQVRLFLRENVQKVKEVKIKTKKENAKSIAEL